MPFVYVTGLGDACNELRTRTGWSREMAASPNNLDVCATTIFRWEHAEDQQNRDGTKRQPNPARTYSDILSRFRNVYAREMGRDPKLTEFSRKQDAIVAFASTESKKRKG